MTPSNERAVLAGGCFWGMQDLLRRYPGVISTRVGYTGGNVPNATYRNHAGHAEAIEVLFDPLKITYRKILEFFFQIHDPTTRNRQGNDVGDSYRSAIFYTSDEQPAPFHRSRLTRSSLEALVISKVSHALLPNYELLSKVY
jgi:peptide-methionine (S)-S-oxide reductase